MTPKLPLIIFLVYVTVRIKKCKSVVFRSQTKVLHDTSLRYLVSNYNYVSVYVGGDETVLCSFSTSEIECIRNTIWCS